MLSTLRIKNLALVADLTLEFQSGLNIITGETGAGKSILIGALNLVLGERADRTLIRSGSDSCSVEAALELGDRQSQVRAFLEANGLEACEDHQLILKRTFTAAGTNRQFINGSPTTLNTLAALGESLVDIHGPHDHQSLLNTRKQLLILDAFGDLHAAREAVAERVRRLGVLAAEKAALIVDEKTYAQQLDLLRFQTREIAQAQLRPEEEEPLEQDYRRASNAAQLLQLSQAALDLLNENEHSVLSQAEALGRSLHELERIDPAACELLPLHQQAVALFQDLRNELSRYAERLELDPARLQELEARLNLVHSLKRKYGATLAEVIAFGEAAQRRLHSLEQRETELARLNVLLQEVQLELAQRATALSAQRRSLVPAFTKAVLKHLRDLGLPQSRCDVALTSPDQITDPAAQISLTGLDSIEFLFAPNPGEPARPLRAIASSGELARVMLALKTVLAGVDEIPVLVFDEVDANVGGQTAVAVGEKMRQIARRRQVLCITHLPQVAAQASAHYVATKQLKAGRTLSDIRLLEPPERVTELARMLGGQSGAARQHAEALLKQSE